MFNHIDTMVKSSYLDKILLSIGVAVLFVFTAAVPGFGASQEMPGIMLELPAGTPLNIAAQDAPTPPRQARPSARRVPQNVERPAPERRARPTVVRPGGRPEGIGRPQGARPQRVRPIRRPAPQ